MHANCSSKETTVFNYLRELRRCETRLFGDTFARSSAADVLHRLREFRMPEGNADVDINIPSSSNNQRNTSACASAAPSARPVCMRCDGDWKQVVERARETTARYFDGLCLDCMDSTKNVRLGGDVDDNYWVYYQRRDRYDGLCRISHGELTWYGSFMGRRKKEKD